MMQLFLRDIQTFSFKEKMPFYMRTIYIIIQKDTLAAIDRGKQE